MLTRYHVPHISTTSYVALLPNYLNTVATSGGLIPRLSHTVTSWAMAWVRGYPSGWFCGLHMSNCRQQLPEVHL